MRKSAQPELSSPACMMHEFEDQLVPPPPQRVRIKRIYEAPADDDGARVLVDRIWPRGVTRERAHLDEWARELAPSTELRRWFAHDAARFDEFRRRYTAELEAHEDKLRELRRRARAGALTLVYGARDPEHNDAVVLAEILRRDDR